MMEQDVTICKQSNTCQCALQNEILKMSYIYIYASQKKIVLRFTNVLDMGIDVNHICEVIKSAIWSKNTCLVNKIQNSQTT